MRQALEMALEALQVATTPLAKDRQEVLRAITAIKEALAQPEQEPVAWLHWLYGPVRLFLNKDEAMMELDRLNREYSVDKNARQMKPLYTTPPQRKPLTDEEIQKCYETTGHYQTLRPQDKFAVFALARAIEAAHGIKE